jgi:hypothetical protein
MSQNAHESKNQGKNTGEKQACKEHERESQKHLTNQIPEDTRRLRPPFLTKITGSIDLDTNSSVDLLRRT